MANEKFTPYALTALPPAAERDVNGVYFIRTPTGMKIYAIANTSGKEAVELDVQSAIQNLQGVTDQGNKTTNEIIVGTGDKYTKHSDEHFEIFDRKYITKLFHGYLEIQEPNKGPLRLLFSEDMFPQNQLYERYAPLSVNGELAASNGNIDTQEWVEIYSEDCINGPISNGTRFFIPEGFSGQEFCINTVTSDRGKEIKVINDSGKTIRINDASTPFYSLLASPISARTGLGDFPPKYSGTFRVMENDTLLEIHI